MNFVIHNWHHDGWWNYCTGVPTTLPILKSWAITEIQSTPNGEKKVEPKNWVGDNWVKPAVNVTGNYKLIFDAHLGRAKIVPAN